MRLTLRTLLAYLDDILPAAETKELGEKITASPVAAQLVDRIRDVMRRRRLTAPEIDGAGGGIEPNLVAEYLDNSLPPERVADVERVCLESDVNLAEVAACHQVLTLVLGEPVDIPGRLRERMYALGPQGTPLEVPEPSPSKNVRETNAREQLAAIQSAQKPKPAAVKAAGSRVPDYLRTPLWRRALPWMIVPLLLLAYLALFWNDPTFFPLAKKADQGGETRVAANEKGDAEAADSDRQERTTPMDETDEAGTAATVAAADAGLPELPVDPQPPADETPAAQDEAPPDQGSPETREAVAATTPESPTAADSEPAAAETTAADAAAGAGPPQVDVLSTEGVVLRLDPQSDQWFPLKADEDPPAGAPVAVPEPFRAELAVAGLPLRVLALGGTRLVPLGETAAADVGIDVAQGRLRISGDTAAANDAAKMMFALRLGAGLWRVEPLTPETVVGIEALPLQPSGEGQDLSRRTPQGVVYVAAGAARVADASGRVEVASAGNRLILTPSEGAAGELPPAGQPAAEPTADAASTPAETDPAAAETPAPAEAAGGTEPAPEAATAGPPASVESLPPLGLPDWLMPREPTAAARRAATAFKAEFIPDAPASASLVPAVRNRNFNVAEPAAKALALIEDVDGLVKTLRDAEHEEAILAAVDGLRNWLGRSPDNGAALRERLQATFPRAGMADVLGKMLWGYGPEDARDTPTAEQLVDWLSHPEPVVRELAFYHVKRLSGRTLNYNPLATQGQRAGAVNQWRAFVARHGGLVVKEQ